VGTDQDPQDSATTELGGYAVGVVPLVLIGVTACVYRVSVRTAAVETSPFGMLWRRIPGLGAVFGAGQWALFCDLLALLLEHQVPWSDSLRYAADAMSGSPAARSLKRWADSVAQGSQASDLCRRADFRTERR